MKNFITALILGCFLMASTGHLQAQELESSPEITPSSEETREPAQDQLIYEKLTMDKLSQLYWALDRLDIDNDEDIDNFMFINECDIFRDYFQNEFEWRSIREASRQFIKENKKSFPLRFEFVQQIKLGAYDLEREVFEILDEHKIKATRRFSIKSVDAGQEICGTIDKINRYPRGIVLELSRPFLLTELPMEKDLASAYVSEKIKEFGDDKARYLKKSKLYSNRDAYLVMKAKMFSAGDSVRTPSGEVFAGFLGVLEGFEVYTDADLTKLVYSKSYRKRRKASSIESQLKSEYQARKTEVLNDSEPSETNSTEEEDRAEQTND